MQVTKTITLLTTVHHVFTYGGADEAADKGSVHVVRMACGSPASSDHPEPMEVELHRTDKDAAVALARAYGRRGAVRVTIEILE